MRSSGASSMPEGAIGGFRLPDFRCHGFNVNILVADEDGVTQALLRTWLQEWDHQVTTADNGTDACKALDDGQFDLVISNWTLSDLDGPDLCRFIRQSPRPGYCYVIL